MQVKVSYTTEIDEIPKLVQDLLSSLRRSIEGCSNNLVFNPNNFSEMLKEFHAVRDKLILADAQLEDILNITAGWLEATTPKEEEVLDE